MTRLLHRINLDVPAGEEHQFRSVLGQSSIQAAFEHDLVYGSGIHADLKADVLKQVDSAISFKRIGRWHLPRKPAMLRQRRLARHIDRIQADALLAWSGFARDLVAGASRCSGVPLLYREGGGAWNDRSPAAAERFTRQLHTGGAICNTHASLRMLQLKWGYTGPARVCKEGVRPDIWTRASQQPSAALRDQPIIGVAARLAAGKGVCLALHALKLLRRQGLDVYLRVAGDGPDRHHLQQLAQQLGLTDYIQWLGPVQDMAAFYASLDVLLHPTLHEALGNVTIEASASGVPVVTTRVDGMAETVLHEQSGMTVPATLAMDEYADYGGAANQVLASQVYDPDTDALRPVAFAKPRALAEAVAYVLADEQRHCDMASQARNHVARHFDFGKYVQELIAAIQAFL